MRNEVCSIVYNVSNQRLNKTIRVKFLQREYFTFSNYHCQREGGINFEKMSAAFLNLEEMGQMVEDSCFFK